MTTPTNPPPYDYNWGVPNISVPIPASRDEIPLTPKPLGEVEFTPVGIYDVRRNLGAAVPHFNRLRHRYAAADLAFVASGASEDGHHQTAPTEFFPEFWSLYDSQPVGRPGQLARKDFGERYTEFAMLQATKWDRATAGTTFIVHVNGTVVPGTPSAPERLKAHVYLPPHFLAHHPQAHPAVAFIVQTVIEQIGVPTVQDWRNKAERVWPLTQTGHVRPVALPAVLIPAPVSPRSAHYIFPGRPASQLTLAGPTPGPAPVGLQPVDDDDLAVFGIDEITDLATAVARAETAEAENEVLRDTIESLQALNAQMQSDSEYHEKAFQDELHYLSKRIVQLENEVRIAKVSLPSSSSRRAPLTPSHCPHLSSLSPRRESPPHFGGLNSSRHAAPASLNSPRRGTPSPADTVPLTTALTDEFLEEHELMSLRDAVILIIRLIPSVHWKDELRKLSGIPAYLIDALGTAMDEDMHGGPVRMLYCSLRLKTPKGKHSESSQLRKPKNPVKAKNSKLLKLKKTRHPSDPMVLGKTESAPRARQPAPPCAPLTAEQKKEKRDERAELQNRIDTDVAEWFSYTNAKAVELGTKYDKKPDKTNPWNAFTAEKAAQRREEGQTGLKAQGLQDEYKEEYEALTAEEKADLVTRYNAVKDDIPKIRRDTAKACVQDVSNTVRNIQMLLHGLSYRVGIEGLFCIVRSTPNFYMGPQWYFTSDALRQYMPLAVRRKWDTSDVGTRLEAFALAGCDSMNLLRTNSQKIAFLKTDIRDRVLSGLVAITGKDDIRMDYMYYEECIVLKYGVSLVGWTCERFVNPSDLSSSLVVLTTLRDALRDEKCKWVKLTPTERKARHDAWDTGVESGKVVRRSRATRSDINKKRKAVGEDPVEDEDHDTQEPSNEPAHGGPVIEEPADSSAVASAPPPNKRRKTAMATAKPKPPPRARKGGASAARSRDTRANKENRGKGPRDDEVTRAVQEHMRRRACSSRIVVSDAEDAEDATTEQTGDGNGAAATTRDPDP
ncbi:hypothetical protein B0H14DRAFT_2603414 [Mycena olivaceomarginata]|nr:hypothetical protein B0H14DRAFT_2603414 [Mycena olivaceomarginata]